MEQRLTGRLQLGSFDLIDVVAELVDHDVSRVAHRADGVVRVASAELGADFGEGVHAHCAWGLWGDGVASPCC